MGGTEFDDKDVGAEFCKVVFQGHSGRMPSRSSKPIEYHDFIPQRFLGDILACFLPDAAHTKVLSAKRQITACGEIAFGKGTKKSFTVQRHANAYYRLNSGKP